MADIYGSHFEFGGVSSRQYGLIIANVDTSRVTQLSGAKESVSIFNKRSKKKYLIGDNYLDSPITTDVEIVTENTRCLGYAERKQITKWLFGNCNYRKLYMDLFNDEHGETYEFVDGVRLRNYLHCRLINPEKMEYNGGIVGYKATLETDSNMFWQDPIVKTYEINNTSNSSTSVSIDVDTDFCDYIYPNVTINVGDVGGDIFICNNTDDVTRTTRFVDVAANATIVMKGEINYVSGGYYEKFYQRNFVRLLDGENKLSFHGNIASVKIEYSARRML